MKKIISILLCAIIMIQSKSFAYSKQNLTKCLAEDPYHILINKEFSLSKDYKPKNLVKPNVRFMDAGNLEKNYMEYHAAKALEKMFYHAKQEGITLTAVSGYRSYSRQTYLYRNAVAAEGINQKGTAKPGESEHQTGLAMDINKISQSFGKTKEGIWLAQNAHRFGFIIRYPQGKEHITGYIYEPWHVRYVGDELANYCYTNKLTLEEVDYCCLNEKEVPIEVVKTKVEEAEQEAEEKVEDNKSYHLIEQEGVTYIKAKDLMECMKGYVAYEKGMLTLHINGMKLGMQAGTTDVKLNDVATKMSYPSVNIRGSMYLPIRSTLSQLGYSIHYSQGKMTIIESRHNL